VTPLLDNAVISTVLWGDQYSVLFHLFAIGGVTAMPLSSVTSPPSYTLFTGSK